MHTLALAVLLSLGVVDRTGLDAPQDFDLTWTPEFLRARQPPAGQTEFVLKGLSVSRCACHR